MRGTAKANAMRSGLVVIGALAFGYLTLHLGFKPYLEKAQLEQQHQSAAASSQPVDTFADSFPTDGADLSSGFPDSDPFPCCRLHCC
ncbi:hypothetical protein SASPL_112313 [Salvia splendens]|uniref:Uncharacterized protein n=1 Tax=Salvia splendens TaxID=180675 RepID=A0A8X8YB01_SALSN|nr:hypothetical protein SASPL_112313 [Salvia splendens]